MLSLLHFEICSQMESVINTIYNNCLVCTVQISALSIHVERHKRFNSYQLMLGLLVSRKNQDIALKLAWSRPPVETQRNIVAVSQIACFDQARYSPINTNHNMGCTKCCTKSHNTALQKLKVTLSNQLFLFNYFTSKDSKGKGNQR